MPNGRCIGARLIAGMCAWESNILRLSVIKLAYLNEISSAIFMIMPVVKKNFDLGGCVL